MWFVQSGEKKWIVHESHEVNFLSLSPCRPPSAHPQGLGHAYLPASLAKEGTPDSSRAAWVNSREKKGLSAWGGGDCRPQGHSLGGGGVGSDACTRVCANVSGDGQDRRRPEKSRNEAGLVSVNSAGGRPSWVTSTIPGLRV